ncbi:hypothetical protein O181_004469 [Austropuccinia psidii MF-1]|uniref:Uncharacterized protein n=1 Tax=Austropuccinia psidii MF-1 TaxID=1389203 RepID=A0A9Q3GEW4_9BASI|nr:hypothetical protein [Austropuccinia psidii MF-1]
MSFLKFFNIISLILLTFGTNLNALPLLGLTPELGNSFPSFSSPEGYAPYGQGFSPEQGYGSNEPTGALGGLEGSNVLGDVVPLGSTLLRSRQLHDAASDMMNKANSISQEIKNFFV